MSGILLCFFFTTQCDRTDSFQTYFDVVQSDHIVPLIALLGCGCSPATEPVAEISHYEDLIHVRRSYIMCSNNLCGKIVHAYMYDTSRCQVLGVILCTLLFQIIKFELF